MTTPFEETIHGVHVRDPYRRLEDRSLPETEAWIHDQQRRCDAYFELCPDLKAVQRRVKEHLEVVVLDEVARVGNRYFYRKRARDEEQGRLYVRETPSQEERVLIDPSVDGRFASVGIYRIAADASLLAYKFRLGGEDRAEIRIVNVSTGLTLPDRIPIGYARGFAFCLDGYFYSQEIDDCSDEHEVRYHSFGRLDRDRTVFRVPRCPGSRLVLKADEHRLGAIWLRHEGSNLIADFQIAGHADVPEWSQVFTKRRMPYVPFLSLGRIFALVATASTSSRLIELAEDGRELRTIVADRAAPIREVAIARDRIFVSYLECGVTVLYSWSLEGRLFDRLPLPSGGSVKILPEYGPKPHSVFFTFESFISPATIYEHDVRENSTKLWHRHSAGDRAQQREVLEITVRSKDGTGIPVTLIRNATKPVDSPIPTIMTSYGGFGVSMTPKFSVLVSIMLDLGTACAIPHVRGGGEFGKDWHDAGRARNRQSSFDDFVAAAEWLCETGLTSPKQLAIFGGSNSGLLVGAAMTQRPDLFGAVLCIAPLLDMVRYEHFDQAAKWRGEYGTVANAVDFQAMYAYSPYHRVLEGVNYPATMFVSGDRDDRCNPAHVRKMAALLQGSPSQLSPVIVDYSEERGHSPAMPLSIRVLALARRIAFLCRELNMPAPPESSD